MEDTEWRQICPQKDRQMAKVKTVGMDLIHITNKMNGTSKPPVYNAKLFYNLKSKQGQ